MAQSIDDRRQVLEERWGPWEPMSLSQCFDSVVEQFPYRPFIITDDASLTYATVAETSRRIASQLSRCGVERGDNVAMIVDNRAEFAALKIGIARIGAVAVPLNFQYRAEELRAALAHSHTKFLFTVARSIATDFVEALDEIAPGWETHGGGSELPDLEQVVLIDGGRESGTTLAEFVGRGEPSFDSAPVDPDSISDIVFTSGTSGHPLAATLTHDMVLRSAYGSAFHRTFADEWRVSFALPMYHVFGYVEGLLASMFAGGAALPRQVFNPHTLLQAVEDHRVNEILAVPTMTVGLVEEAAKGDYDLSSLQSVFSAAAPAPVWLWERVQAELRPRMIFTGYGQTEVSAATTLTLPGDSLETVSETVGTLKLGGVASIDGTGRLAEYRTVSPMMGSPLSPGAEGELSVSGPIVSRGYFDDEERNEAMFDGDWLRTGDLGTVDSAGYLRLTGRARDLYKCGGELVSPKEVEDVIKTLPGIEQAYVAGVPDELMGQVGAAWVVPDGDALVDSSEIRAYCRNRLAAFKVPRFVSVVSAEDLPMTTTGKVQKFLLVERHH
ncbi:class I adenylate-forming enzyme family protein [Brevibacterium marinum]|uniref:Fatty-acyl-CoA synthase n=1 Tax=Brevibacterium marinum TaxID=418643 RepID=A0A846S004_9MICO|nr:AMP-binding protein [Brevibacterium marinum]NJC56418.1 fatty-acyl-CoA synthase [Brevibacterium marinum]